MKRIIWANKLFHQDIDDNSVKFCTKTKHQPPSHNLYIFVSMFCYNPEIKNANEAAKKRTRAGGLFFLRGLAYF